MVRTGTAPTAATDDVRWLDEDEMSAWLPLLRLVHLLPQALDRQLREQAGVNHVYYMLLALLSGQPDRRLPLTELARAAAMSQSRASHAVAALVDRDWVTRKPCPSDRRVQYVQLTPAGTRLLEQNAPGHAAEVRRLVFDQLDAAEVRQLRGLAQKILATLDA
jgi:DNA-binding MarR family transcriptional regulator